MTTKQEVIVTYGERHPDSGWRGGMEGGRTIGLAKFTTTDRKELP